MENKVRVALIGYGYWGPNILRNLKAHGGFEVCGVVDANPKTLEKYSRTQSETKVFSKVEELLSAEKPQAVVIATPPVTHHAIAIECLKNGADIMVEKPLALSVAECDDILNTAKKYGRKVMVDHTFVYNPAVQYLQESVSKGSLGDLLYYDSVRINLGGFQVKTNVLWDLAPHDLSILDLLTNGKMPTSVTAVGIRHFDKTVENLCYVHLSYEGKFSAHLNLNWVAPLKVRSIILGGSKRMAVYDENLSSEKVKVYDKGMSVQTPEEMSDVRAQYRTGDMIAPAIPIHEALQGVVNAFHQYVCEDKRPVSDGESGRRIVQILEAAAQSLQEGGAPIRLNEETKRLRLAA